MVLSYYLLPLSRERGCRVVNSLTRVESSIRYSPDGGERSTTSTATID